MRLWSIHPRFLDRQGLTAAWREALLAQTVIGRSSGGYSNHPQLQRFRCCLHPDAAVGTFLAAIASEADARGYNFNRSKIVNTGPVDLIPVTVGQVGYEWEFLLSKLRLRSPEMCELFEHAKPEVHPLFTVVPGGIESWERPKL